MKPKQNTTKPINEATATGDKVRTQAGQGVMEVERRIAYLEAVQDFQLMAKKRSRPFWKKILSIK